jgi:hypothetical protein
MVKGAISQEESGRGLKLTTHLHLVPTCSTPPYVLAAVKPRILFH